MKLEKISHFAEKHGYGSELCTFLDKLEKNGEIVGVGRGSVEESLSKQLPEYTVIKVALANRGRALSDFLPGSTEKSRNEYTPDDWAKAGTEEFLKHCTPAGKFRYADFKYEKRDKITQEDIKKFLGT